MTLFRNDFSENLAVRLDSLEKQKNLIWKIIFKAVFIEQ